MIVFQILLLVLSLAEETISSPAKVKDERSAAERHLPKCVPPFFGSPSKWGPIEVRDGERRELFLGEFLEEITATVIANEWWLEVSAFILDVGEDLGEAVHEIATDVSHVVVDAAGHVAESSKVITQQLETMINDIGDEIEDLGMEALAAVEGGIGGIAEFVTGTLAEALCLGGIDSCLLDITAQGCLPGASECIITYGENCLKMTKDEPLFGITASEQREMSNENDYIEYSAAVEISGGAHVAIETSAAVAVYFQSEPKIRIMITPPEIEIAAEVEFKMEASLEANVEEKRVNLSPPKIVYRRVFMAGYIPVIIVMRAQPVAFVSAHGSVSAEGNILLSATGTLGFDEDIFMELNLTDFSAGHNFVDLTVNLDIEDKWEFNFEANADLELVGKIGVELSFTLYDVIEFNFLPQFVTKFNAEGQVTMSGSGNHQGGDFELAAEATATLCLGGDVSGYFDWVDHSSGSRRGIRRGTPHYAPGQRPPSAGRRRLLKQLELQRRELGSVDFGEIVLSSCDAVIELFQCPAAEFGIRGLCGLAIEGLKFFDFPFDIDMPDMPDLSLPSIPIPPSCFTVSGEVGVEATFPYDTEKAKDEGVECGGFFSGTNQGLPNIHGNTAGDAIHTFIAGSSEMIVDACHSTYDSYIRVFGYEVGYLAGAPYVKLVEIAANDDHSGRCTGGNNRYASHLHLTHLVAGQKYILLVEGFRSAEGTYHVKLECPDPTKIGITVDRNGDACLNYCQDNGEHCDWCGIHEGYRQLCCRRGYSGNHPNCATAEYSNPFQWRHQCVVTPIYTMTQSTGGCPENLRLTESECRFLDDDDYGVWGGTGHWGLPETCECYYQKTTGKRYFNVNRAYDPRCHMPETDYSEMMICKAGRDCAEVTMRTGNWGYEMSWSIHGHWDDDENPYPNLCQSHYTHDEDYTTYQRSDCCLESGKEYKIFCDDSYGDGWNGGYLEINGERYCDDFTGYSKRVIFTI